MPKTPPHSALRSYDAAMANLERTPSDIALQHEAILALARAGSTDLAILEYTRYGFDSFNAHGDLTLLEDILSLGGRLQKDLYWRSTEKKARDYALNSAERYETAFRKTGGYYSGINAATMSLLANVPTSIVEDRARNILNKLPSPETPSRNELYFIEATRAEALLLLGDDFLAHKALWTAVRHDPLNYTAHASTLRQFRAILTMRNEDLSWLAPFTPPKSAHYAGHIFSLDPDNQNRYLSPAYQDSLEREISDTIQREDIGFGFGALAAGSDILIAETLLSEGAELNIALPVNIDNFIKSSVTPFGSNWKARFHACLDKASSLDIAVPEAEWPDRQTDSFTSGCAMGMAIMQAEELCSEAVQFVIWDGLKTESSTANDASRWISSNRRQFALNYPGQRAVKSEPYIDTPATFSTHMTCDGDNPKSYDAIETALETAQNHLKDHNSRACFGIDISPGQALSKRRSAALAAHAVPGSILLSEAVVSQGLLEGKDSQRYHYLGRIKNAATMIRAFAYCP